MGAVGNAFGCVAHPKNSSGLAVSLIGPLARDDAEAALNYIKSVTSEGERTQLLRSVVSSLAHDDPTMAAAYALALPPGSAQNDAVNSVVTGLASRDPKYCGK